MNRCFPLRLPTLLLALALPFALAACGNKGPLVLPDKPADTPAAPAAAPAADAPADQSSDQTTDTPPPPADRDR